MMGDVLTVAWKESQELLARQGRLRGGAVNLFLILAVFGVAMPWQFGRAWVESPMMLIYWAWVPLLLLSNVVVDAFVGTDVPTSYVVSVDATDEQLRSLLWFFRQKVRTGAFKDIGITQPTTVQFGQFGYAWGMLVVFRGEKCANEYYISDGEMYAGWTVGFCGPGEHNDATYHWGIEGDPLKDSGTIRAKNGDLVEVFSYKDNWHPSSKAVKHSTRR